MPFRYILAATRREALDYAEYLIKSGQASPMDLEILDPSYPPRGVHNFDVLCIHGWDLNPTCVRVASMLSHMYGARLLMVAPPAYNPWTSQYNPYNQQRQQPSSNPLGGSPDMDIKAKIWWDTGAGAYVISVAYNEKFIEAIKMLVPSGDRTHDPSTKFWYVKESYGDFVHKLAQDSFGVGCVSFTSKSVAEQAKAFNTGAASGRSQGAYLSPSTGGTTEDAVVAFFNLVPYDAAKRCYLLAAQALHPDKPTGDGQKMTKLNELWVRIEKEFFKR